jgi:hypothetical protein
MKKERGLRSRGLDRHLSCLPEDNRQEEGVP